MLIVGMNFAVRLLHCLMGRVTLEFGKVQKDYYYQISINHFLEDNSYIVNTKKPAVSINFTLIHFLWSPASAIDLCPTNVLTKSLVNSYFSTKSGQ